MSLYLFIYFFCIIALIVLAIRYYKNYFKYDYGKYLVGAICFYTIWLILYLSSFTTAYDKDTLLILSKLMYWLGPVMMYSIGGYILFFNKPKVDFSIHLIVLLILILTFFGVVFSPLVIQDMSYDQPSGIYFEVYGIGYSFWLMLYLLYPFFTLVSYYYQIKGLSLINKLRFNNIVLSFLFLAYGHILFLVILPFIDIWILLKEQVLLFIPFIFFAWYSIDRYHFHNSKIGIGKLCIFCLSLFWSIIFVNIFKYYFILYNSDTVINFWGISEEFGIVDLVLGIIIFLLSHKFFTKIILGDYQNTTLNRELSVLKGKASFITSLPELNTFLQKKFQQLFKIKYVDITIFKKVTDKREIYKYFSKNELHDLFINDIVFIEENKNKFDYEKIKMEINSQAYLILPLFNKKRELIGMLSISAKPFKDNYYTEEINSFKRFAVFLEGHLQYMKTYAKIHDLTVNLDKKVDEQTIEYNNLISKQKDFISIVSHEVKGPIASALFQADSIKDDFEDGKYDKEYMMQELHTLNEQLRDTGELVNRLFNVQKYEKQGFKLYKEKIEFKKCMKSLVEGYQRTHEDINISLHIDAGIGFIEIDKTQFRQVINNLLTNAIKFSNEKKGKIHIFCFVKEKQLFIEIEDNGIGFKNMDVSKIFDKYSTGEVTSIGLGMGLYLCKKIIELHGGQIRAEKSKTLGGAKFILNIPK